MREELLMTSKQAAAYLGYADRTLRESRSTRKLAGVKAPIHIKMGWHIRYDPEQLEQWSDNLKK